MTKKTLRLLSLSRVSLYWVKLSSTLLFFGLKKFDLNNLSPPFNDIIYIMKQVIFKEVISRNRNRSNLLKDLQNFGEYVTIFFEIKV